MSALLPQAEPLRRRRRTASNTTSSSTSGQAAPPASRNRSAPSWCCILLALIPSCILAGLVYLAVSFGIGALRSLNQTHPQIAFDHDKHPANASLPLLVKPLINSTSRFDVEAMVWMDVTQHLAQGGQLPEHMARVFYQMGNATDHYKRTEQVLYQGVVFRNITMDSTDFATIPLKIPIEPLYTQVLGPSSLRITFNIRLPEEEKYRLGRPDTVWSAFPLRAYSNDLVLPRSSSSKWGHGLGSELDTFNGSSMVSLEQAMDHTASSTPLLTLVPTPYSYENSTLLHAVASTADDAASNIITNRPTFFDHAFANTHFVHNLTYDAAGRPLYLGSLEPRQNGSRIWLPHIRSRARVVMLREESQYELKHFKKILDGAYQHRWCFFLPHNQNASSLPRSCYNIRRLAPIETLIQFDGVWEMRDDPKPEDLLYHYPPALFQAVEGTDAAAHRYTLPIGRPGTSLATVSSPSDQGREACRIPLLPTDANNDYFEMDLEVRFSSHKSIRAGMIEGNSALFTIKDSSDTTTQEVPLLSWNESEQIRLPRTPSADDFQEVMAAILHGDRLHRQSRPWTFYLASVFSAVVDLVVALLPMLYWRSRRTTAGLSLGAQWLGLLANVLELGDGLVMIIKADDMVAAGLCMLLFVGVGFLVYYRLRTLLRVQIVSTGPRRWQKTLTRVPMTRLEERSQRQERDLMRGWRLPLLVFSILSFLRFGLKSNKVALYGAKGCHFSLNDALLTQADNVDKSHWAVEILLQAIPEVLFMSCFILQACFNAVHTREQPTAEQSEQPASRFSFRSEGYQSLTTTSHRQESRGTYAGEYKISTFLTVTSILAVTLINDFERIGGYRANREPVTPHDLMHLGLHLVLAGQAVLYPSIRQPKVGATTEEEEDFEMEDGTEQQQQQEESYGESYPLSPVALPVEKIREWIGEMKVDARKKEAEDLNEEWYKEHCNPYEIQMLEYLQPVGAVDLQLLNNDTLQDRTSPSYLVSSHSPSSLPHERLHALHYLSSSYRSLIQRTYEVNLTQKARTVKENDLKLKGYDEKVWKDEFQAYLSEDQPTSTLLGKGDGPTLWGGDLTSELGEIKRDLLMTVKTEMEKWLLGVDLWDTR